MPDGIDTFKTKFSGKKQILFISPNEGDCRVRPDEVNFEAPADGVYSWGTNSTGAVIESFTDPLTLSDEIYIYDQAGVGSSGDFEAEEEDEFFITQKYGVGADDDWIRDFMFNNMGEYFFERQKWDRAASYFTQSKNVEKLVVCSYLQEEYDELEKIIHVAAGNHELLANIGSMFWWKL